MPVIPGLTYLPDFLDAAQAEILLAQIDAMPWLDVLQRRVQHHGYRYDYKARRVTPAMHLGPLPDCVEALALRLFAAGLVPELPDQAIANEYLPGQGISAHVDCEPCFGEAIVTLSLGGACEMEFVQRGTRRREALLLAPRSALIFRDEARHRWTHAIKPRLKDDGVPRTRRVSLTFRRVRLGP